MLLIFTSRSSNVKIDVSTKDRLKGPSGIKELERFFFSISGNFIPNFVVCYLRMFELLSTKNNNGRYLKIVMRCISRFTMDFKPSVSVLFGHYSLPRRRILTKLGRAKFEKTT